MSYITAKYTRADPSENVWQEVVGDMLPSFKEAGAMRQVVTQVWNSERNFILGNMWEYADEKGPFACQKLFREAEARQPGRGDHRPIPWHYSA